MGKEQIAWGLPAGNGFESSDDRESDDDGEGGMRWSNIVVELEIEVALNWAAGGRWLKRLLVNDSG